jgi:hypothetical protein
MPQPVTRLAIAGLLAGALVLALVEPTGAQRPQDRRQPPPPPSPALAATQPQPSPPEVLRDPAAFPEGARSPRNANYSIDAALDVAARTITGREVITWRNITAAATSEIRLHLYWNAWKNTRSTFLREAHLAANRGDVRQRPLEDFSHTTVSALRLLGAGAAPPVDLTGQLHFVQPDDGNADDQTVARVPLPIEVRPGDTVNLEVEWTARVPRTFARTGTVGRYYFLAQWFPKVGVLENTGWNAHQFHASTEFFSDFGNYDVRLRVPSGWVLGATGVEQSRTDHGDGTTTHRYVQDDVHDFAWTTSPDYVERTARFEHATLPATDMRLLVQPEHLHLADRYLASTRAALRYYGEWFGPYPYGHITVIDPAWQSGSGGMEYPTLFTGGTRWLAPPGVSSPEGVTVHEAGHQFWYGIVASNEFEHAWMDEGFNTYSTGRVLDEFMPERYLGLRFFGGFVPWVVRDVRLTRENDGNGPGNYRRSAEADVPAWASWRYWPATASGITYSKTAVWLNTLERMLGWTTMQRVMSTYFERWKFRHPRPQDFFAVANQVSGQDLTWFFDQVHRRADEFDYAVQHLATEEETVRGLVDRDGKRVAVGSEPLGKVFETTVVVRREGEGLFPVDVLVRFEDGSTARERWNGVDRWKLFRFERASRAVSAEVDPDRILLLDVDVANNSRTLDAKGDVAAMKWSMRWLVWLQDVLLTYGFFV